MTDEPENELGLVTGIIPFLGTEAETHADKWLATAIRSLPEGMPYLIATNGGKHEMASALNVALQNVQTEFVFAMGADDKCGKYMVDQLFEALGTADIAYPTMRGFGALKFESRADLPSMWRLQDQNLCGVFIARTESLRDVGGWNDELYEDWDLMYRLWQAGKKFVPVPNAIYHYRIHKGSLSHRIMAEADKLGVDPRTLAPNLTPETRVPMIATFYAQAAAGTAYVRSELPARYLPGVARQSRDIGNVHQSHAAVFELMEDHELMRTTARFGRAAIVNVDDDYLTPSLVAQILNSGRSDAEFQAKVWAENQPAHRQCVRMADAVVAATAELAMTYSTLNKNVHLIPNMVDPDDWVDLHPMRLDDTIRVVWPAGRQHAPDAPLIEGAMRWASAQPNVEVVCMGLDPGWDFAYHHEPTTPSLQTYRDILSIADIVVAPVTPTAFNRGKSDLKWLEAAMVGAAFLGSKTTCYSDTVWHETNGILARGKRDFERYMRDLVGSQEMRLELGKNAHERVLATRHAKFLRVPYLQMLATCGVGGFQDFADLEPELQEAHA